MTETQNLFPKHNFQIDTRQSPIGRVIEFLDAHLPNFPSAFRQMTLLTKIESEDDVSQELWAYLQRFTYADGMFMFQFQRKQPNSNRSSDFGVLAVEHYSQSERSKAFFLIEAKRLPTPGSGRQKEYLEGNLGGVQRYKKGHHGKDLLESAIIGYIQDENNCNHWYKEINNWITELINTNKESDIKWETDDYLVQKDNFSTIQKYTSKNKRIVNSVTDFICLHHYLMKLT